MADSVKYAKCKWASAPSTAAPAINVFLISITIVPGLEHVLVLATIPLFSLILCYMRFCFCQARY
ncbi:unnamed protein product [Oikopleura dioica]|uniref:Uncharacterized protein n=1 Tax=Oikopleura dioica TaxID=34765 RepID=E4X6V3_OIKDI|nr:unnamed protein product [Oikopleura dioica]